MPLFDSNNEAYVTDGEADITGSTSLKTGLLLAGVTTTNSASFIKVTNAGALKVSGSVEIIDIPTLTIGTFLPTASVRLAATNVVQPVTGTVVLGEQPIKIKLRDSTNNQYFARVDASGRVLVSVAPPTAPPATTPVNISVLGDVSTTTDNVYVIPSGQTLHLQRFSGGGEGDTYTSVVELFFDPNGNASGMSLIRAGYVFGNNFDFTLDPDSQVYNGDGTRSIRLRRRRIDGGTAEIAGFWDGYLE